MMQIHILVHMYTYIYMCICTDSHMYVYMMYIDKLLLGSDKKQQMKSSTRENDVIKTTIHERYGKSPSGLT